MMFCETKLPTSYIPRTVLGYSN